MDNSLKKDFQYKLGIFMCLISLFILAYNTIVIVREGSFSIGYYFRYAIPLLISFTIGILSTLKRSNILKVLQVAVVFLQAVATMLSYSSPIDLTGETIAILGIYICIHYGWFLKHFYIKIIVSLLAVSVTKLFLIYLKIDIFAAMLNRPKIGVVNSFLVQFIVIFTIVMLLWIMTRDRIQEYIKQGKGIEDRFRQNSTFIDIGKIVWGFLHDLGNLNYSLADIKMLKRRLQICSEQEAPSRDSIKEAIIQAERIEEMLSGVDKKQEQIKKMVRTKHVISKERIDVNDLISNLISFLKMTYNLKNINLNIKLNRDKIFIKASPFEIMQAIENIVRNSIEAMMENGGQTLTIKTSIQDNFARIFIEDTGGGISFLERDGKVDLKEFQIGRTTKNEKGTGWGMYSAVTNIHHNAGQLFVKTKKEVGTSFEILLELDGGNNG